MENASKALLIAGGVLISILVISSFTLFFSNLNEYEKSETQSKEQAQVVKFNNQYTAYDKSDLTLNKIKSLYNKIEDNNEKYNNGEPGYYKIEKNIEKLCNMYGEKGENGKSEIDIKLVNFKTLDERVKNKKYSFKCVKVEFENEGGRISKMLFSITNLLTKETKQTNELDV